LNASGAINNSSDKLVTAGTLNLSTGSSFTHSADSTLRGDTGIRLASAGNLTLAADLNTLGLLQLSAAGALTNNASQVGNFITLDAETLSNNGVI
ncbi:MAG: hypothetical protein J0626_11725, partial [Rhodospirillaceae bacterium]|nr:hypothetical protein [Rhodospirillaceae bacterium]